LSRKTQQKVIVKSRSPVANLVSVAHGARNYRELAALGLNPSAIIDFSANSNPYGPPPAVLEAVQAAVTSANLAHYPDRHCLALTEAIAAAEGVSPDCILPTNGASELIQVVALAFIRPGSRHLVLTPTFGEYARAIQLMGGEVIEHWAGGKNLHFEPETVAAAIHQTQPDSIWLCNPNNPTGQSWQTEELALLFNAAPNTLWVVDESYHYFSNQISVVSSQNSVVSSQNSVVSSQNSVVSSQNSVVSSQNSVVSSQPRASSKWQGADSGKRLPITNYQLSITNYQLSITLRSLTKEFALAGLRLGYGVAAPEIVELLRVVQPPWSVNSLAQMAGVAALQPKVIAWRAETLTCLHRHAAELWAGLAGLGYTVLPTATPFALVEVGDAPAFRRRLLTQHGLLVRDCASFGLPHYVRIAARLPEENEKLLHAVEEIQRPQRFCPSWPGQGKPLRSN
jgi:threonine-phosphate decarboxylase